MNSSPPLKSKNEFGIMISEVTPQISRENYPELIEIIEQNNELKSYLAIAHIRNQIRNSVKEVFFNRGEYQSRHNQEYLEILIGEDREIMIKSFQKFEQALSGFYSFIMISIFEIFLIIGEKHNNTPENLKLIMEIVSVTIALALYLTGIKILLTKHATMTPPLFSNLELPKDVNKLASLIDVYIKISENLNKLDLNQDISPNIVWKLVVMQESLFKLISDTATKIVKSISPKENIRYGHIIEAYREYLKA